MLSPQQMVSQPGLVSHVQMVAHSTQGVHHSSGPMSMSPGLRQMSVVGTPRQPPAPGELVRFPPPGPAMTGSQFQPPRLPGPPGGPRMTRPNMFWMGGPPRQEFIAQQQQELNAATPPSGVRLVSPSSVRQPTTAPVGPSLRLLGPAPPTSSVSSSSGQMVSLGGLTFQLSSQPAAATTSHQVYPPGTFVTANNGLMASGLVLPVMSAAQQKKVSVPWGWKRLLVKSSIVYIR